MVRNIKVMNMAGRDLASRNDINKSSRNLKEGSVKYEIHRIYWESCIPKIKVLGQDVKSLKKGQTLWLIEVL